MASDVNLQGSRYGGVGNESAAQRGHFGASTGLYVNVGNFGAVTTVTIPAPSLWRIEGVAGTTNASIWNGGVNGYDTLHIFYDAPGQGYATDGSSTFRTNWYSKVGAYVYFPVAGTYSVFADGAVGGYIRAASAAIQVGGTLLVDIDPVFAQCLMNMDPPSGVIPTQGVTLLAATSKVFEPLLDATSFLNINGGLRLHSIRMVNTGANPATYAIGAAVGGASMPFAAGQEVVLQSKELVNSTLALRSTLGSTILISGTYR